MKVNAKRDRAHKAGFLKYNIAKKRARLPGLFFLRSVVFR